MSHLLTASKMNAILEGRTNPAVERAMAEAELREHLRASCPEDDDEDYISNDEDHDHDDEEKQDDNEIHSFRTCADMSSLAVCNTQAYSRDEATKRDNASGQKLDKRQPNTPKVYQ